MKIDYKVPNGKLLRIDAEIANGIINSIRIHGDFFAHPEECINEIETALVGQKIDDKLMVLLVEKTKGCKLIGVTTDAILLVLKKFLNPEQ